MKKKTKQGEGEFVVTLATKLCVALKSLFFQVQENAEKKS